MFTKGKLNGSGAIFKALFIGSEYLSNVIFLEVNYVSSVHNICLNHRVVTVCITKALVRPWQNTPSHVSGIMGAIS